jgi:hypothetical protein
MRQLIGAMLLLGCFAMGCDDDSGSGGKMDLSVKVNPDMTMVFGTMTCGQVLTCVAGCAGSTTCVDACTATGTQAAQTKFGALVTCGITACAKPYDAGATPECSSATDTSLACQGCIATEAQAPGCATQLTACESDK